MWIRTADDKLVNLEQFGCLVVESVEERSAGTKWFVRAAASQQTTKGNFVDIASCRNEQEALRILDRVSALMRRVVLDLRNQVKRPAQRGI